MTKLKKSIAACMAGTLILTGAVFATLPAQHTVYAEGDGTNSWIKYPHVTGWEYDSFSIEKNLIVAVPEYGANGADFMKCSFKNGNGQNVHGNVQGEGIWIAVDREDNNSLTFYYPQTPLQEYRQEDLAIFFNSWTPDDYTVTVTVEGNMPQWSALVAEVPFTVSKAKNYWTVTPGILSWYQDEAEVNPAPYGEAAYGDVEFTVYGASAGANGVFDVDKNKEYPINMLRALEEGTYALVAEVEATENYEGIEATTYFRVFDSEAPLAALNAAKEAAREELNDFANDLGVKLSDLDVAVTNGIEFAATVKEVKDTLEDAKVAVYKEYAFDAIVEYAKELNVKNYESAIADEKRNIEQAGSLDAVKTALASAKDIIYSSFALPNARTDAQGKAQQFATQYGVAYNHNIAWQNLIDNAETLEEVDEALNEVRKDIIEVAFENASDLATYKDYVKQAIVHYAVYLGVDKTEMGTELIRRYQGLVELASSRDAVTAQYEGKDSEEGAKAALNGIRSNEQAQFMNSLTETVDSYKTRYPAAAAELDKIIARVRDENLIISQLTVPKSRRVYEGVLAGIRECVLEPAKKATIDELKETVDKAGMTGSYDTDSVINAINHAESIEEVEAIFNVARHEIGSALYESRVEKIAELEAFAEEHYTDYNWHAINEAVADGKKGINNAQTYAEINDALDKAKLGVIYAHTDAELDHYASVYASYNVANAVASGKNKLQTMHTEEEYLRVLDDTKVAICSAAKQKAISDLEAHNDYYLAWDRTSSVKKLERAETVEEVVELYLQADAELMQLVNKRAAAMDSAREMLTLYAENLGVDGLKAVKDAIDGILAAQTTEEVPALFDTAKETIDRAADAEQKRIDSTNKAAIAFAVIFGVAVAGLGTALGLILYKDHAKKKKNGDGQPPQPHGPAVPPQPQSSINYPFQTPQPVKPEEPVNPPQHEEPPMQQAQPTVYPPQHENTSISHEEQKQEEASPDQEQLTFFLPQQGDASIPQGEPVDHSAQHGAPSEQQEPYDPFKD